MLKVLLLGALLGSAPAFASNEQSQEQANVTTTNVQVDSDTIVHRHSLAAHIGLTTDEAYFGAPREGRGSRYLDDDRSDSASDLAPLMPRETPH